MGAAIAQRLAQDGYRLTICDVAQEKGEAVARSIGGAFLQADVSKASDVQAVVADVVKAHGRLDAFVNNAGVVPAQKPLGDFDIEEWHRVVNVNLHGAFYGLKFALAQMVQQPEGGSIVNVGSIAGFRGLCNLSPYTASKFALRGLTQQAAVEYGEKNIRVNAVAPTGCETDMVAEFIRSSKDPEWMLGQVCAKNAQPGLVQPSDVASAVAFLLSEEARFITGHTLPVDAGSLCRMANSKEVENVK